MKKQGQGKRKGAQKYSKKGEPPRWKRGTLRNGKTGILFFYDPATKSVDIGPQLFRTKRVKTSKASTALMLEEGGMATMKVGRRGGRRVRARYEERPYLEPAIKPSVAFMRKLLRDVPFRKG